MGAHGELRMLNFHTFDAPKWIVDGQSWLKYKAGEYE